MKTNFSGPEFIAIVGTLFLALVALNQVARLQRNLKLSRKTKFSPSLTKEQPASQRTPTIRVIALKEETEEKLVEAS